MGTGHGSSMVTCAPQDLRTLRTRRAGSSHHRGAQGKPAWALAVGKGQTARPPDCISPHGLVRMSYKHAPLRHINGMGQKKIYIYIKDTIIPRYPTRRKSHTN